MAATIIDSRIFGNLFSTEAMRQVWSDENRTAKYLDIERALAIVQGRLGIIPQEAADEIVRNCAIEKIDMDKLRTQTERIGYPVLGVVSQSNALCRDKLGEFCHWGATTQDITDTATVMQIRDALELVDAELMGISQALADLARRHRDTPVVGRSNLQQAIPVTFGYKMATILAAVERHRERLEELRPRVLVGEFGGACGTLASIQKGAMETQAGLMAELNLAELGAAMGRERAHDLVYDLCREAIRTHRPLLDQLAEDPEITRHLGRAALEKLCDPANYLGQAGAMVDRVLAARAARG